MPVCICPCVSEGGGGAVAHLLAPLLFGVGTHGAGKPGGGGGGGGQGGCVGPGQGLSASGVPCFLVFVVSLLRQNGGWGCGRED